MQQYRDTIIKMVNRIQSEQSLKRIYKLVLYLYTRD